MIVEGTVLTSEWLKHPEYGVAALLPLVPRNKPGGGMWRLPETPTIYDDVQDKSVAAELEPTKVPALVVFADSDIDETPTPHESGAKGDGLDVVIAYIVRNPSSLLDARRDGMFVLRAVRQSLHRLQTPKLSTGHRRLNGISISRVQRVTLQRVAGAVGRSTLAGFVIARYLMLDENP